MTQQQARSLADSLGMEVQFVGGGVEAANDPQFYEPSKA